MGCDIWFLTAEGQFLQEEMARNMEKSLRFWAGIRRPISFTENRLYLKSRKKRRKQKYCVNLNFYVLWNMQIKKLKYASRRTTTVVLRGGVRIVPTAVKFPCTIHSFWHPRTLSQMNITDAYSHTGLKMVRCNTTRPPRVEKKAVIIWKTPRA